MSATTITPWALPQIARLLPIDDDSLKQIIDYTLSLPTKEASAEHLKNLLGDSPQALEFIASFNSRRRDAPATSKAPTPRNASPAPARNDTDDDNRSVAPPNKRQANTGRQRKQKAPLHNAGPARRPENFGNITGGYKKADIEEDYMAGGRPSRQNKQAVGSSLAEALSLSDKPAALQLPRTAGSGASTPARSTDISRTTSPAPGAQKSTAPPPPSAAGSLISDFMPNVRSKTSKATRGHGSGASTPRSGGTDKFTTSSINDLTSAIALLELSTNPALKGEKRKCNCNGAIHPLFTVAPNCLACGKIICALEGLQPCSFCGAALLRPDEIQDMIHELRSERGTEKTRAHNTAVHKAHEGGPGSAAASTPSPETAALMNARAHRDKLLNFQSHNAQRTRVFDEAADFDTMLSAGSSATQWMTPAQRALALKKQQRVMREMEEQSRPEYEKRGKVIMSLDFKGGKVVKRFERVDGGSKAESEIEDAAAAVEEHVEEPSSSRDAVASGRDRQSGLGRNPLLAAGGLVRPVWKPADADAKGKGKVDGASTATTTDTTRRQRSNWGRVVQDDQGDNEGWILDGGIQGHGGDEDE